MFYLLHNTTAFLLILCVVFALTSSIISQPVYFDHRCLDQSNETANADYKSNLTVLLESLSSKASQNYSFYNESSNVGIYGLYLCQGDVSNETCQICLSYATQDITTRCPSNKSAIIWYDKCLLRYSNVDLFGVASWSPAIIGQNTANQPDFYSLDLLKSLIKRVNVAEKLQEKDERMIEVV
ncbi:cysteine-rich receptor-like protein kinase 25 [Quercus suber]|uniref:Cysteine-rich receptor-like protein kinase 25 n=1 Tax=Quercus suber TaxID=58331 RepID=A0AAW0KPL5_QUESU